MTGDRGAWGPLAWRLLAAFVLVALSSVVVITGAALLGTGRGLAAVQAADRQQVAAEVAGAVGVAYTRMGGWSGVDLDEASAVAAGARAHLTVRDESGSVIAGQGRGRQAGTSGMAAGGKVDAPVVIDGTTVGTVVLTFPTAAGAAARSVAWGWIALAAVVALAVALTASWFVSMRIAGPLVGLAAAGAPRGRADHCKTSPPTEPRAT